MKIQMKYPKRKKQGRPKNRIGLPIFLMILTGMMVCFISAAHEGVIQAANGSIGGDGSSKLATYSSNQGADSYPFEKACNIFSIYQMHGNDPNINNPGTLARDNKVLTGIRGEIKFLNIGADESSIFFASKQLCKYLDDKDFFKKQGLSVLIDTTMYSSKKYTGNIVLFDDVDPDTKIIGTTGWKNGVFYKELKKLRDGTPSKLLKDVKDSEILELAKEAAKKKSAQEVLFYINDTPISDSVIESSVFERIDEYMHISENKDGNHYLEWTQTERDEYQLRYLDFLLCCYSAVEGKGGSAQSEWKKAIQNYKKDNGDWASARLSAVSICPAVVGSGYYDDSNNKTVRRTVFMSIEDLIEKSSKISDSHSLKKTGTAGRTMYSLDYKNANSDPNMLYKFFTSFKDSKGKLVYDKSVAFLINQNDSKIYGNETRINPVPYYKRLRAMVSLQNSDSYKLSYGNQGVYGSAFIQRCFSRLPYKASKESINMKDSTNPLALFELIKSRITGEVRESEDNQKLTAYGMALVPPLYYNATSSYKAFLKVISQKAESSGAKKELTLVLRGTEGVIPLNDNPQLVLSLDGTATQTEWKNFFDKKYSMGLKVTISRSTKDGTWKVCNTTLNELDYLSQRENQYSITQKPLESFLLNKVNVTPEWKDSGIAALTVKAGGTLTVKYKAEVEILYKNKEADKDKNDWSEAQSIPAATNEVTLIYKYTQEDEGVYISEPDAFAELKEGSIYQETFEAMAGVPSTRTLYFSTGGAEFMTELRCEPTKDQISTRKYTTHFNGVDCEFKTADNSKTHSLGGVTVNTHTGGSYTASQSWSGSVPNKASAVTQTALHSVTVTCPAQPDRSAYNAAMTAAQAYADQINATILSYTSGSDKKTRQKSGWGASVKNTVTDPVTTSASDNKHCSYVAPSGSVKEGNYNPGTPCGNEMATATATPGGPGNYRVWVEFSVPSHCLCGPCCEHFLPAIEDTWVQKATFDTVKITDVHVWKLESGYVMDMEEITYDEDESVESRILQGDPNIFYNLAAGNTSKAGRLRYTLQRQQGDEVYYEEMANGALTRTNKCNGLARTLGANVSPAGGGGHSESWATGILYTNSTFSNTLDYHKSNSDTKDKVTLEWNRFDTRRNQTNTVTIIGDMLILQTSSGDQSLLYHESKRTAKAQENFKDVEVDFKDLWANNPLSSAKWNPAEINIGSYNGHYETPYTKYKGTGNGQKITTAFDDDAQKAVAMDELGLATVTVKQTFSSGATYKSSPGNSEARMPRATDLRISKSHIRQNPVNENKEYITGQSYAFYLPILSVSSGKIEREHQNTQNDLGQLGYTTPSRYRYHDGNDGKVNDIVVHDPVSVSDAVIVAKDRALDQRTQASRIGTAQEALESLLAAEYCPGLPGLCDYRVLNCTFSLNIIRAAFDFEPIPVETDSWGDGEEEDGTGGTMVIGNETGDTSGETVGPGGNTPWKEGGINAGYDDTIVLNRVTSSDRTHAQYTLPDGFRFSDPLTDFTTDRMLLAEGTGALKIPLSDLSLMGQTGEGLIFAADMWIPSSYSKDRMLFSIGEAGFYIPAGSSRGAFLTGDGKKKDAQASITGRKINLEVTFRFGSLEDCKVKIDGEEVPLSNNTGEITSRMIGDSARIGCWEKDSAYESHFYLDNLTVARAGGVLHHTDSCYTTRTIHALATQNLYNGYADYTTAMASGIDWQGKKDDGNTWSVAEANVHTHTKDCITKDSTGLKIGIALAEKGDLSHLKKMMGSTLWKKFCQTFELEEENGEGVTGLAVGIPENLIYTGNIQSRVLLPGTYKLEGWGAKGGDDSASGGKGGYVTGTLILKKKTTIYIGVGGAGGNSSSGTGGGFNGGGNAGTTGTSGGGGGATHMATQDGTLNAVLNNAQTKDSVLLTAGGGGGAGNNGSTTGYGYWYHTEGCSYQYSTHYTTSSNTCSNCGHGCGYLSSWTPGGSDGTGAGGVGGGISGGSNTYGIGGSSSRYYALGKGGNCQVSDGAGGGGGYYGGFGATGDRGAGGGSGYVSSTFKDGNTIAGNLSFPATGGGTETGHTGNGHARITLLVTGLPGIEEIVVFLNQNLSQIPDRVDAIQNPVWNCKNQYSQHVCTTECREEIILSCREPHHEGFHYDYDDPVCYDACHNDAKHSDAVTEIKDTSGKAVTMGDFITLDQFFEVYFPNRGDFYGNGALGIGTTVLERGKGYMDAMDTSEWTREKKVRFPFDVLYERDGVWETWPGGNWIPLEVRDENGRGLEHYRFYCLLENGELSAGQVDFAVEAINCSDSPGGKENPYEEDDSHDMDCPLYDNHWVTNRQRLLLKTAYHSAYKMTYIDVVGRIGNLMVEDTDDMRYSNFFKNPLTSDEWLIEGIIRKVDPGSPKNYLAWFLKDGGFGRDIRGEIVSKETGYFNTWDTLGWAARLNPSPLPVAADRNTTTALKMDQLKLGYDILWDISTMGDYEGHLQVMPYFYALNTKTDTLTPVDVYISDAGEMRPINYWGLYQQHMTQAGEKDDFFEKAEKDSYEYIMYLNWEEEAERRNYTLEEEKNTKSIGEARYTEIYDSMGEVIATKLYTIPYGNYYNLGTMQLLTPQLRARTYIGSPIVNSVDINGGTDTNFDNVFGEMYFWEKAQRWHIRTGLPSSATFVAYRNGEHHKPDDIIVRGDGTYGRADWEFEGEEYVILMTASIIAVGDTYDLAYDQGGDNGAAEINGKTYSFGNDIPTLLAVYDTKSSRVDIDIKHTH